MSGMNFLERLLDGAAVEWKPLGDVAKIKHGKDWKGLNPGDIPVYGSGGIMGYVDRYLYDKPTVLIPRKGSITNIFYVKTPFWNVDTIYYTEIDTLRIVPKYLYHFIKTIDLTSLDTGSGRPSLTQAIINKILIPIPCPDNPDRSLAIQAEIVRILDTFTELSAELSDRKKQYEYYRDRLLTFEEGEVEWKPLGEIGKILRGTAITEKETNPGDYPVVANGPSHNYFHDQSNRSGETIVIARSGVYAGLVSYWDIPIFLTDAFSIHPDNNALSSKFLYYVLKKDQTKIHNMSKGAGVPHVRAKEFESYKVPVLPLEEQARIVAILDKFDTLTTSISEGLPREIALRQQQYEYYRDLLLNFPPPLTPP